MDNPWDEDSPSSPWGEDPSPSASDQRTLPEASPAISVSTESSTGPDWEAPAAKKDEVVLDERERVSSPVEELAEEMERSAATAKEEQPPKQQTESNEATGEARPAYAKVDEVAPSTPLTPAAAPALSMTLPPMDDGPPMDDFSDDEQPFEEAPAADDPTTGAEVAVGDSFDDFDDFGEAGAGGDDDDFGDFGDFDEGDMGAGDDSFGGAGSFVEEAAAPALPPPQPVATTSRTGHVPLQFDLSDTSKAAMEDQLKGFLAGVYPGAEDAVSDEPERQVEGAAQVLVSEPLRGLLSTLSSIPPLRPLDWRRSRIRREHLIALGVPVNLDDSADAKPLASLVLPSQISTLASSPSLRSASPSGPRSSSPSGAAFSPAIPYPPSRSSTPFADRERQRASALPPPLDRKRAEAVCAVEADDLVLLSLPKLRVLRDEIDSLSNDASGVLTHALLMREKEVTDAETYNGMIQDLVMAAAKAKTTGGRGSGTPPMRSGSGRWGRSAVK